MAIVYVLASLLIPLALTTSCGSNYVSTLVLYQSLTQGSSFMPDKGGWVHHMAHSTTTSYNSDGMMYDNAYTTLLSASTAAFAFTSDYFMYIYVKAIYSATAPTTQIIFQKLLDSGSPYLSLTLKKETASGTLLVVTPTGSLTYTGFFTYGQYVRVGVSHTSNNKFHVYKDLTSLDSINKPTSDDSNTEIYVGGDAGGTANFYGQLKQLTIWTDSSLVTYPLNTAVDQVCDEEFYHTSNFDVGADYYWPGSSAFGTGWYHVRRLAPSGNAAGWFYMQDASSSPVSDVLSGSAVPSSASELAAFDQKSLTLAPTGQYVRYFLPWQVEEYLVVTGDRSAWIRFSKSSLNAAVTSAKAGSSFPFCVSFAYTASSESASSATVTALFTGSGTGLYLGPYDLGCSNVNSYNTGSAPIYGETLSSSNPILTNNLLARNGVNVFVRLSSSNLPKCGDSFRTSPEECDDGNAVSGDGCDSTCKVESGYTCVGGSYSNSVVDTCTPACGNGIVGDGETCDPPSTGCSSTCQVVDGYYVVYSTSGSGNKISTVHHCDTTCAKCDGAGNNHCTGCGTGYRLSAGQCVALQCGDGVVTGTETCDPPSTGCSSLCAVTMGYYVTYATDSDGYSVSTVNQCDTSCNGCTGAGNSHCATCATGYRSAAGTCVALTCGDGLVTGTETCDPPSAGCSSLCVVTTGYYATYATNSDGYSVSTVNQCDVSCNGCTGAGNSHCTACAAGYRISSGACIVLSCGDGVVTGTETCDPPSAGCSSLCAVTAGYYATYTTDSDGNSVSTIHQCDASCNGCTGAGNSHCTACATGYRSSSGACVVLSCGDGVVTGTETCDPPSAGCSSICAVAAGYYATYTTDSDGNSVSTVNQCDTSCNGCTGAGNTHCTACATGYKSSSGACVALTCGDGVVTGTETCDPPSAGCSSLCTVMSGYYVDYTTDSNGATISAVHQCDSSCNGCTGAGNTHCTACATGYRSLAGACIALTCGDGIVSGTETCDPPSTGCSSLCAVVSGYYVDYTTDSDGFTVSSVHQCDSSCNGCTGAGNTHCTACATGYRSSSGACVAFSCGDGVVTGSETCDPPSTGCSSLCAVISGYYVDYTTDSDGFSVSSVHQCDTSCNGCTGSGNTHCTACATGYKSSSGACVSLSCGDGIVSGTETCDPPSAGCSSLCTVAPGYYVDYTTDSNGATISAVHQCDASCNGCTGSGNSHCTACASGYRTSSGACVALSCGDGIVTGTETCDPPSAGCSSLCTIIPGYYADYTTDSNGFSVSSIHQCDASCNGCTGSGNIHCTACASGYVDSVGTCVPLHCGDGIVSGSEECDPPAPGCDSTCKVIDGYYADYIIQSNGLKASLVYHCDASCKTCTGPGKAHCKDCADTYLKLAGDCALPSCGDGIIMGSEQCDPPSLSGCDPLCTVSEGYYVQYALRDDGYNVSIIYQCDSACRKCVGGGSSNCTECSDGYSNETGTCVEQTNPVLAKVFTQTNAATGGVVGASALMPSSGVQSVFSLLEIMQFVSLFSLISVESTPVSVLTYYDSLGMATLEFLPNFFDYVIPHHDSPMADPDNTLTGNFKNHPSLKGKDFLFNIGENITMIIILVVAYVLLLGVSKAFPRLRKWRVSFQRTVVWQVCSVTFLEVILSSCIQIRYMNTARGHAFSRVSSMVAIICLALEILFLYGFFMFYYRLKDHNEDKAYMESYSSMVEEYQCKGIKRFTPFVLLIRVITVVPIMIALSDYPLVQSTVFLSCNILVSAWMVVLRPKSSLLKNVFACLSEIAVLTISSFYVALSLGFCDSPTGGLIIICCMMSTYMLELVASVIESAMSLLEWIRELRARHSQQKCLPELAKDDSACRELDDLRQPRRGTSTVSLRDVKTLVSINDPAKNGSLVSCTDQYKIETKDQDVSFDTVTVNMVHKQA